MHKFTGKTAVISGGAEGIGYSIADALGAQGMNLVLADIDTDKLKQAEANLTDKGYPVLTVMMDVTSREQWQATANQALEKFGKIHMVINNAGVASAAGPIESIKDKDWNWVMDVNLMGVIYGVETIIPHIKQHGEGGWVINVASMAGMRGIPFAGPYTASKAAVVALSEAWAVELQQQNIAVSVLCPAFVQTRIHLSGRNRQQDYKDAQVASDAPKAGAKKPLAAQLVENGIPVEVVGKRVVEALNADEFYIFTHPGYQEVTAERSNAVASAFEKASQSPLLQEFKDIKPVGFF